MINTPRREWRSMYNMNKLTYKFIGVETNEIQNIERKRKGYSWEYENTRRLENMKNYGFIEFESNPKEWLEWLRSQRKKGVDKIIINHSQKLILLIEEKFWSDTYKVGIGCVKREILSRFNASLLSLSPLARKYRKKGYHIVKVLLAKTRINFYNNAYKLLVSKGVLLRNSIESIIYGIKSHIIHSVVSSITRVLSDYSTNVTKDANINSKSINLTSKKTKITPKNTKKFLDFLLLKRMP